MRKSRKTRQTYNNKNPVKLLNKKVNKLYSLIETKYVDLADVITDIDRDGVIDIWNGIPQGDTDSQRNGDKLVMKELDLRMAVWHDPQTGNQGASSGIRFLLFYDKQNTIGTVADLLDVTANDTTNMLSPITWDLRKQVKIIRDVLIEADGVYKEKTLKRYRVKLNHQTQFSAGTTTITTGALKAIFISDRASTDNYLPQVHLYYRLTYTDL
jgi:hypothetical protein